MLTILGPRQNGFCDRISRRGFLQAGALTFGGLTLADVLRAEAAAGTRSSHKAVIMVFLSGGPPHQDMFDLKPDAPVEIRGEFSPIHTSVPGIEVCELLPRIAATMDRYAVIRSVVGSEGRHAAFQCMTGRPVSNQPQGGWPSLGSAVSKLQGPTDGVTPPFVGLSPRMITSTWADAGQPGFLGVAHSPFKPSAEGAADMTPNAGNIGRLDDRRDLLAGFDRFRRQADSGGLLHGHDVFNQQALDILSSSRMAEALDLEREDPELRDRYGRGCDIPAGYGDAGPLNNDYLLMARRLVEAGARVVTLAYGRWDWHGQPYGTSFENSRVHFPALDQGLTALMDDLQVRGLDRDVTVIVWGEFGRTPKINAQGGRDHWPAVACALLAGGGMPTGQVIGSTNRLAEHAKDRPVHFQEIFATLYRNLGIDVNTATVADLNGRPQYLVDHAQPLPELI
jgi:hypothetical protein